MLPLKSLSVDTVGFTPITLEFDDFSIDAELFDTPIAQAFINALPYHINLEQWGNELYGSIHRDLGTDNPRAEIPPGGLAYTNNGNYLCVFYGQQPAWPVEYIGQINGDSWQTLLKCKNCKTLVIKAKQH